MNGTSQLSYAFVVFISAIFTQNILLSYFLGLCPFIGVSREVKTSFGLGLAVIFVMTTTSMLNWLAYHLVLEKLGLEFFRFIMFIIIIAAFVQFVEMVIQKVSPGLYRSLGIYLPLITTNCAVLGVSILNIDSEYNFIQSLVNGFASGIGFTLALVLMAGLREKLDLANVPRAMKGAPIAFIMAGCMSLAFMGFSGLKIG